MKKKPKMRIPLPRKTGGVHKPKKGKGAYKRKPLELSEEDIEILKEEVERVRKELVEKQVDLPPEFSRMVDKRFWELV